MHSAHSVFAHKKRGYENIIHFWQHDNRISLSTHTAKPSCTQKSIIFSSFHPSPKCTAILTFSRIHVNRFCTALKYRIIFRTKLHRTSSLYILTQPMKTISIFPTLLQLLYNRLIYTNQEKGSHGHTHKLCNRERQPDKFNLAAEGQKVCCRK